MSAYTGTPTNLSQPWEEGDRFGKRLRVKKRISLTLSAQGGATNNIPATQLGFKAGELQKVEFVAFVDDSGSQKRALFVWTDGTYLYVGDPQVSTDADRGEPVDVTGVLSVEVSGLPL